MISFCIALTLISFNFNFRKWKHNSGNIYKLKTNNEMNNEYLTY